ncbi:MAG: hypothetical protein JWO31_1225 [Phycisphaerales bacterium]|nr:hypothetical protein [Phycisphaerales bacterium]
MGPAMKLRYIPWLLVALYVAVDHASYGYMLWKSMDFPSFYWGAQVTFQHRASPYTVDAFTAATQASGQKVYPYLYPPPSLLAFYPLSHLSYKHARLAMLGVNELCLVGFLYVFLFRIMRFGLRGPMAQIGTLAVVLYVVLSLGVARTVDHGQINLVVLLAACLSWDAMKRGAPNVAVAAPLAFAVLLKTYPVLLVPLLVMRRRYGAAAWVGGLLAAATALAWAVLPGSVWGDWARNVLPTGGYGQTPFNLFGPGAYGNQSINGFAARLFMEKEYKPALWYSPAAARATAYALCGLVVAGTLAVAWWSVRRDRDQGAAAAGDVARAPRPVEPIDLEWSLALAMTFMVAPLSWHHHLVFALPAVIVSLRLLAFLAGAAPDAAGHGRDPARAAAATFWIPPVLLAAAVTAARAHFEGMGHHGGWVLLASRHLFAVGLLWGFLAWWMWRSPRLTRRTAVASPGARGEREPAAARVSAATAAWP